MGGSHIANESIFFVTGHARQWLRSQGGADAVDLSQQQPDGSFRYQGKFLRGHFENTASGACAWPAAMLLEYARLTGDPKALAAGLRTLDYMQRLLRAPGGPGLGTLAAHARPIGLGLPGLGLCPRLRADRKGGVPGTGPPLGGLGPAVCLPLEQISDHALCHATRFRGHPVGRAELDGPARPMGRRRLCLRPGDAGALRSVAGLEPRGPGHFGRRPSRCNITDGPYAGLLPDSFTLDAQRRNPCGSIPGAGLVAAGPGWGARFAGGRRRREPPRCLALPGHASRRSGDRPRQARRQVPIVDRRPADHRRGLPWRRRCTPGSSAVVLPRFGTPDGNEEGNLSAGCDYP